MTIDPIAKYIERENRDMLNKVTWIRVLQINIDLFIKFRNTIRLTRTRNAFNLFFNPCYQRLANWGFAFYRNAWPAITV